MGFALSWLGVRGKSPEVVLEELGLRLTGEHEDIPESGIVCASLSTGWFVVVMNNSMAAYDGSMDVSRLSRGAEVVTCMLEEHVMMSGYARWKDGTRMTSVMHDAQHGVRHLDSENLPPDMTDIAERAKASQDKEDEADASTDFIFDVPIDVAYRVTGFRHDRADRDGVLRHYDILEPLTRGTAQRGGWLRGVFRRGSR